MANEIQRNPTIEIRGGKEFVTFDADHSLSDFVRYLIFSGEDGRGYPFVREELRRLVDTVGR